MMRRKSRNRQFYRSLFLLSLVFCIFVQKAGAERFTVYDVVGRIKILDASGQSSIPRVGSHIEDQTRIRVYRDSSISLKGEGRYYRVYASSLVQFQDEPLLVYGKLSSSTVDDFIDLHFYFLPTPAQGRTIKVVMQSKDRDIEVHSSLLTDEGNERPLSVYSLGDGRYRALSGFDCEAPPIRYKLYIEATRDSAHHTQIVYPFFLKETRYPTGKVVLPPAQDTLLKPSEKKRRQSEKLLEILSTSSEQSLWESAFIHPIGNPEIISAFGKRRTYYMDGKPIRVRHHRGVDYRALRGTPVIAPSGGIVVFAAERVTTGNTLVIDHGHKVFSLFFHLDSITVKEGDRVAPGDKIAEAGSTGIAAGPHLHWGLWIDGTYVDPLDWLKRYF